MGAKVTVICDECGTQKKVPASMHDEYTILTIDVPDDWQLDMDGKLYCAKHELYSTSYVMRQVRIRNGYANQAKDEHAWNTDEETAILNTKVAEYDAILATVPEHLKHLVK